MINEYIILNYQGTTVNENYLDVKCAVKDPRSLRRWVYIVKWTKKQVAFLKPVWWQGKSPEARKVLNSTLVQ